MPGWMSVLHPDRSWPWLLRDQIYESDWWEPGKSESPIRGKLTIPRFGQPTLHFEGGNELYKLPIGKFETLHGRIWALSNAPATVLESFARHNHRSFGCESAEVSISCVVDINIQLLLIGLHLNNRLSPKIIGSASLVSPYLHRWARFEGFTFPFGAPSASDSEYIVSFRRQHTDLIQIAADTTLQFECILHHNSSMMAPETIGLQQHTVARLQFDNPRSFHEFQREIEKLMTFISFCLRRIVDEWEIFITFAPEGASAVQQQPAGSLIQPFSQFQEAAYNPALLTRKEVELNLVQSLQAWWANFDKLGTSLLHHLSALGDRIPYAHVSFLNIMQGLEAYHRRFFEGRYENVKEAARTLRAAVPKDCPKQTRKILLDRLAHVEEYTLFDRICEIFLANEEMVKFGFSSPERQIREMCQLRNTLTHALEAGDHLYSDVIGIRKILRAKHRATLLLEAAILSCLAIDTKMARRQLADAYGWIQLH